MNSLFAVLVFCVPNAFAARHLKSVQREFVNRVLPPTTNVENDVREGVRQLIRKLTKNVPRYEQAAPLELSADSHGGATLEQEVVKRAREFNSHLKQAQDAAVRLETDVAHLHTLYALERVANAYALISANAGIRLASHQRYLFAMGTGAGASFIGLILTVPELFSESGAHSLRGFGASIMAVLQIAFTAEFAQTMRHVRNFAYKPPLQRALSRKSERMAAATRSLELFWSTAAEGNLAADRPFKIEALLEQLAQAEGKPDLVGTCERLIKNQGTEPTSFLEAVYQLISDVRPTSIRQGGS